MQDFRVGRAPLWLWLRLGMVLKAASLQLARRFRALNFLHARDSMRETAERTSATQPKDPTLEMRPICRDMTVDLGQTAIDEQMMPELRGDDGDEAQLDRRFLQHAELPMARQVGPILDGID